MIHTIKNHFSLLFLCFLSTSDTYGNVNLDFATFLNSSAERGFIQLNEFPRKGKKYPSCGIHYAGFCLSRHLRPKMLQSRVDSKFYLKPQYGNEIVKAAPLSLQQQITALEILSNTLNAFPSLSDKQMFLDSQSDVKIFLSSSPLLAGWLDELEPKAQFAIKCLLAIGQGPIVFQDLSSIKTPKETLAHLVQQLLDIETFYHDHGGIIGYQLTVLHLLNSQGPEQTSEKVRYEHPPGFDLSKETASVNEMVRWGIENLGMMGEMYAVGGAGDRLNLRDEETGELLPAAQLIFGGKTLWELLIRDLQGREFLYYKLFGKQLVTPIAAMTSHEKNNHQRMLDLCESNEWFGRPRESYQLFLQPLVPMVSVEGEWAVSGSMQLILKPGGHGVIWKAAVDQGVFEWLEKQQRKKLLIRQINNPIASVDSGLLALSGIGCHQNKDFGFASCERILSSAEGMDVLREENTEDGYSYGITNIEYTEFKKHGIDDAPLEPGSPYSRFPANTNILFGDIAAIKTALGHCAIPGKLINMKSRISCHTPQGSIEKHAGRLESTMQNIADLMTDKMPQKLSHIAPEQLRTFLTYNERKKTISVTKQAYVEGKPLEGTPEGCFFDVQNNYRDLLLNYCHMEYPEAQLESDYLTQGPDCLIQFHPAVGILYGVVSQKIRGGKIAKGSELVLEISEIDISNLNLDGSLIVEADAVMGEKDAYGILRFNSGACGKCTLVNVTIRNQGRERLDGRKAWQCQHPRKEALRITLHGNAEFFAENVQLEGDVHFDVPDEHRLVVYQQGEEIAWHFEKIYRPTWKWEYFFDEDSRIKLERG